MSKFREIIQSEIPTLVDFYATWCGPCQQMHPILDKLKDKMGSAVRVVKIDVDKNQQVANTFQIQGVPTLILFKNGEIKWRQSGVVSANNLAQIIKQNS